MIYDKEQVDRLARPLLSLSFVGCFVLAHTHKLCLCVRPTIRVTIGAQFG